MCISGKIARMYTDFWKKRKDSFLKSLSLYPVLARRWLLVCYPLFLSASWLLPFSQEIGILFAKPRVSERKLQNELYWSCRIKLIKIQLDYQMPLLSPA